MLEIKNYKSEQLAEALGISANTLNAKRKITEERHLSKYNWSKEGKGKKVVYKIEGLNEIEPSPIIDTFYSLLEDFSGQDVYFKNPETSIKVLYYLHQRNENIAFFISRDLGIAESTVRDYIKRFRKLGLLVGYWDNFIVDGKEVEKHVLSQTQYDYYQVVEGKWYETNLNGWKAAWDYKRNAYEQFVEDIESETGWTITKEQDKEAKIFANQLMIEELGVQRRVEHKYLNEDAKSYLGSFLVYAGKELGLSFERKEKKSDDYIKSLYKKRSFFKNTSDELIIDTFCKVVDVGRKHVGEFEEWLIQQHEKMNEQEPFQIGFITNNVKGDKRIIKEKKPMSFKQLIVNHEFMKVPEVPETIEEEVEELELQIVEDPFTGRLEVFNEKTQQWEDYNEYEWINGKKIEKEVIVVPFVPQIGSNNSLALEEMFNSLI